LAIAGAFGTSSKAMTIYNTSGANASNVARIEFKLNNTFSNGSTSAAIYGMNPNASGNNGGALVFAVSSNGTDTNPSERARIDSSGSLLVGTTSTPTGATSSSFNSNNTGVWPLNARGRDRGISFILTDSEGYAAYFERNQTGGLAATGYIYLNSNNTTTYATSSDYRLKENIAPMTGALQKIAALKPCTYTWKSNGSSGDGFIAHELQEVCPQAVHGEKDAVDAEGKPQHQGVDTSFLVATLTAAIQEQQALIQSLTDRITALETPAATPPVNEQPA
jgi:hypothetical protein